MSIRYLVITALIFTATPLLAQAGGLALHSEEATFEGLGDLAGGAFTSGALGVSADGVVVVGAGTNSDGVSEAFRWEGGTMTGLGNLGGSSPGSIAWAVSADGSIVVGESSSPGGQQAFRWEAGTMTGLGDLTGGAFSSTARGISPDGTVIVGAGSPAGATQEAFRWESGTMIGLGALSFGSNSAALAVTNSGFVYGASESSSTDVESFIYGSGSMNPLGAGDLPGGDVESWAYAVAIGDFVVVGFGNSDDGREAYRYTFGDGMVGLGDLPGGFGTFHSEARDVSADGSRVVGCASETAIMDTAFFWSEAIGMLNFKGLLEGIYGLDLTGWTLQCATGISADGTVIVGLGTNPSGDLEGWRAFLGTPVADEATPAQLADGLTAPSPNPVRGSASLTLRVAKRQHVHVEVFDALGRRVRRLYDASLAAGMSETLSLDASALPAGVYVIRATGEGFTKSRRFTVVR